MRSWRASRKRGATDKRENGSGRVAACVVLATAAHDSIISKSALPKRIMHR
jgi:hypothetical protein